MPERVSIVQKRFENRRAQTAPLLSVRKEIGLKRVIEEGAPENLRRLVDLPGLNLGDLVDHRQLPFYSALR